MALWIGSVSRVNVQKGRTTETGQVMGPITFVELEGMRATMAQGRTAPREGDYIAGVLLTKWKVRKIVKGDQTYTFPEGHIQLGDWRKADQTKGWGSFVGSGEDLQSPEVGAVGSPPF